MRAASAIAILTLALISASASAAPTVDVAEPLPYSVGQPTVHVHVTCQDGGGPCAKLALLSGDGSAFKTVYEASSLDFDLELPDGLWVPKAVGTAHDQTTTSVSIWLFVVTSPSMHLADVAQFFVVDEDLGRVVSISDDGRAQLLHRDDCSIENLDPGGTPAIAWVSSRGVFVGAVRTPGSIDLVEWRDTRWIEHGSVAWPMLHRAGRFFVWAGPDPAPQGVRNIYRVDVDTGIEELVASNVGCVYDAITADGAVFYCADGPNGRPVTHRWTSTDDVIIGDGVPRATDGNLTVTWRTKLPDQCELLLYDGQRLSTTLSTYTCALDNSTRPLAAVRDGWVAYTRWEANQKPQVWVLSPSGVQWQLTMAPPGASLVALGDHGEVIVAVGSEGYIVSPTRAMTLIDNIESPIAAQPKLVDGHWMHPVGRDVFGIDEDVPCPNGPCPTVCDTTPMPVVDAGVPDAGSIDARAHDASVDASPSTTDAPRTPDSARDAAPGVQGSGGGCGCRTSGDATPPLSILVLVFARRRNQRSRARRRGVT